jgi:phage-related protein
MFNRSAYNRTSFNRSSSIVFEWLATANAETDASATATGVSTYGSITMQFPGLTMTAGDELIIDTGHMTITLNGANVIDLLSDDSEFFKLKPGENDIIVEGGTTADIKVLWKDRWL